MNMHMSECCWLLADDAGDASTATAAAADRAISGERRVMHGSCKLKDGLCDWLPVAVRLCCSSRLLLPLLRQEERLSLSREMTDLAARDGGAEESGVRGARADVKGEREWDEARIRKGDRLNL